MLLAAGENLAITALPSTPCRRRAPGLRSWMRGCASARSRLTGGLAPLAIGLGVGLLSGGNGDIAIETNWEAPGQVVHAGATLPLRGEPRAIAGVGRGRAAHVPQCHPRLHSAGAAALQMLPPRG